MQLPAEATFTLSSSYEATVTLRLTRFTRKRCENGPTLHVPMVSCLMTPPSHNSVLRCSLLKDRLPSWLINFLLAAQFWGTISTLALCSHRHHQSDGMIPAHRDLLQKTHDEKETVRLHWCLQPPSPGTSRRLGGDTAPVRRLHWLSSTSCGRRCGPGVDAKLGCSGSVHVCSQRDGSRKINREKQKPRKSLSTTSSS